MPASSVGWGSRSWPRPPPWNVVASLQHSFLPLSGGGKKTAPLNCDRPPRPGEGGSGNAAPPVLLGGRRVRPSSPSPSPSLDPALAGKGGGDGAPGRRLGPACATREPFGSALRSAGPRAAGARAPKRGGCASPARHRPKGRGFSWRLALVCARCRRVRSSRARSFARRLMSAPARGKRMPLEDKAASAGGDNFFAGGGRPEHAARTCRTLKPSAILR